MSKVKIEKELIKVRGQLQSLQKKEAYLEQELKMAEAAEKQAILDKHHISVEELRIMLKSMRKVRALSRLAGGNPRGCNVGIY